MVQIKAANISHIVINVAVISADMKEETLQRIPTGIQSLGLDSVCSYSWTSKIDFHRHDDAVVINFMCTENLNKNLVSFPVYKSPTVS